LADDLHDDGQEERAAAFFAERHTSLYRLTSKGRAQARAAGAWLKENLPGTFDLAYSSDFARARETAGCLGIEDQVWHVTFNLHEREHGVMRDLKGEELAKALAAKKANPFYWRPLGGESIADLCVRVDRVLKTVRERYAMKRVIIVAHAEIIQAFRVRIEHILPEEYKKFNSGVAFDHTHNGQVLHYSRRNPLNGEVVEDTGWVRSVCPWDMSLSRNEFERVERAVWNSEQMLTEVSAIKQQLDEEDKSGE
jgi:broad specificity phosphatase PhoE